MSLRYLNTKELNKKDNQPQLFDNTALRYYVINVLNEGAKSALGAINALGHNECAKEGGNKK
jgi:hypothetical protein